MNRVLLKLYWMTVKASLRSAARKFSTVRGAILSLVTLSFVMAMAIPVIVNIYIRRHTPLATLEHTRHFMDLLPLVMLLYLVASVTSSLGERAILFSASEIDFLFPAPFSRRQLLGYYLLRGLVAKLVLAILFAISFSIAVQSFLCAIVGFFMSLVFLHGASVAAQLLQQTISAQTYSKWRQLLVMTIAVAIGFGLMRAIPRGADIWTFLDEFRSTALMRVLLAPFAVFSRIIAAPRFTTETVLDLSITLGINAVVYWLIFALDSRYEDFAVQTSQRTYERLQAAKRGNAFSGASTRTEYARSLIPQLPWWYGVGPNLRRQLLSGCRNARSMMWVALVIALIFAGTLIYALRTNPKLAAYAGYMVLGATAYMTFVLSAQMPLGFRSDLGNMEVLKSLPLHPTAIASAQVISASIIACLPQWLLVLVAIVGAPSQSVILLSGGAFFVPFNLILFGINSLLLLLFPFRLAAGGFDVTLFGRVMIMMAGTVFALASSFALAAIPAFAVFLVTRSWLATLAVAWGVLMFVGIGVLWGVAWAFQRFDVSSELPD